MYKIYKNANYGIYRYKNKTCFFFVEIFDVPIFETNGKTFWHFGCNLYNKLLFCISDSDYVYFSVYMIIF